MESYLGNPKSYYQGIPPPARTYENTIPSATSGGLTTVAASYYQYGMPSPAQSSLTTRASSSSSRYQPNVTSSHVTSHYSTEGMPYHLQSPRDFASSSQHSSSSVSPYSLGSHNPFQHSYAPTHSRPPDAGRTKTEQRPPVTRSLEVTRVGPPHTFSSISPPEGSQTITSRPNTAHSIISSSHKSDYRLPPNPHFSSQRQTHSAPNSQRGNSSSHASRYLSSHGSSKISTSTHNTPTLIKAEEPTTLSAAHFQQQHLSHSKVGGSSSSGKRFETATAPVPYALAKRSDDPFFAEKLEESYACIKRVENPYAFSKLPSDSPSSSSQSISGEVEIRKQRNEAYFLKNYHPSDYSHMNGVKDGRSSSLQQNLTLKDSKKEILVDENKSDLALDLSVKTVRQTADSTAPEDYTSNSHRNSSSRSSVTSSPGSITPYSGFNQDKLPQGGEYFSKIPRMTPPQFAQLASQDLNGMPSYSRHPSLKRPSDTPSWEHLSKAPKIDPSSSSKSRSPYTSVQPPHALEKISTHHSIAGGDFNTSLIKNEALYPSATERPSPYDSTVHRDSYKQWPPYYKTKSPIPQTSKIDRKPPDSEFKPDIHSSQVKKSLDTRYAYPYTASEPSAHSAIHSSLYYHSMDYLSNPNYSRNSFGDKIPGVDYYSSYPMYTSQDKANTESDDRSKFKSGDINQSEGFREIRVKSESEINSCIPGTSLSTSYKSNSLNYYSSLGASRASPNADPFVQNVKTNDYGKAQKSTLSDPYAAGLNKASESISENFKKAIDFSQLDKRLSILATGNKDKDGDNSMEPDKIPSAQNLQTAHVLSDATINEDSSNLSLKYPQIGKGGSCARNENKTASLLNETVATQRHVQELASDKMLKVVSETIDKELKNEKENTNSADKENYQKEKEISDISAVSIIDENLTKTLDSNLKADVTEKSAVEVILDKNLKELEVSKSNAQNEDSKSTNKESKDGSNDKISPELPDTSIVETFGKNKGDEKLLETAKENNKDLLVNEKDTTDSSEKITPSEVTKTDIVYSCGNKSKEVEVLRKNKDVEDNDFEESLQSKEEKNDINMKGSQEEDCNKDESFSKSANLSIDDSAKKQNESNEKTEVAPNIDAIVEKVADVANICAPENSEKMETGIKEDKDAVVTTANDSRNRDVIAVEAKDSVNKDFALIKAKESHDKDAIVTEVDDKHEIKEEKDFVKNIDETQISKGNESLLMKVEVAKIDNVNFERVVKEDTVDILNSKNKSPATPLESISNVGVTEELSKSLKSTSSPNSFKERILKKVEAYKAQSEQCKEMKQIKKNDLLDDKKENEAVDMHDERSSKLMPPQLTFENKMVIDAIKDDSDANMSSTSNDKQDICSQKVIDTEIKKERESDKDVIIPTKSSDGFNKMPQYPEYKEEVLLDFSQGRKEDKNILTDKNSVSGSSSTGCMEALNMSKNSLLPKELICCATPDNLSMAVEHTIQKKLNPNFVPDSSKKSFDTQFPLSVAEASSKPSHFPPPPPPPSHHDPHLTARSPFASRPHSLPSHNSHTTPPLSHSAPPHPNYLLRPSSPSRYQYSEHEIPSRLSPHSPKHPPPPDKQYEVVAYSAGSVLNSSISQSASYTTRPKKVQSPQTTASSITTTTVTTTAVATTYLPYTIQQQRVSDNTPFGIYNDPMLYNRSATGHSSSNKELFSQKSTTFTSSSKTPYSTIPYDPYESSYSKYQHQRDNIFPAGYSQPSQPYRSSEFLNYQQPKQESVVPKLSSSSTPYSLYQPTTTNMESHSFISATSNPSQYGSHYSSIYSTPHPLYYTSSTNSLPPLKASSHSSTPICHPSLFNPHSVDNAGTYISSHSSTSSLQQYPIESSYLSKETSLKPQNFRSDGHKSGVSHEEVKSSSSKMSSYNQAQSYPTSRTPNVSPRGSRAATPHSSISSPCLSRNSSPHHARYPSPSFSKDNPQVFGEVNAPINLSSQSHRKSSLTEQGKSNAPLQHLSQISSVKSPRPNNFTKSPVSGHYPVTSTPTCSKALDKSSISSGVPQKGICQPKSPGSHVPYPSKSPLQRNIYSSKSPISNPPYPQIPVSCNQYSYQHHSGYYPSEYNQRIYQTSESVNASSQGHVDSAVGLTDERKSLKFTSQGELFTSHSNQNTSSYSNNVGQQQNVISGYVSKLNAHSCSIGQVASANSNNIHSTVSTKPSVSTEHISAATVTDSLQREALSLKQHSFDTKVTASHTPVSSHSSTSHGSSYASQSSYVSKSSLSSPRPSLQNPPVTGYPYTSQPSSNYYPYPSPHHPYYSYPNQSSTDIAPVSKQPSSLQHCSSISKHSSDCHVSTSNHPPSCDQYSDVHLSRDPPPPSNHPLPSLISHHSFVSSASSQHPQPSSNLHPPPSSRHSLHSPSNHYPPPPSNHQLSPPSSHQHHHLPSSSHLPPPSSSHPPPPSSSHPPPPPPSHQHPSLVSHLPPPTHHPPHHPPPHSSTHHPSSHSTHHSPHPSSRPPPPPSSRPLPPPSSHPPPPPSSHPPPPPSSHLPPPPPSHYPPPPPSHYHPPHSTHPPPSHSTHPPPPHSTHPHPPHSTHPLPPHSTHPPPPPSTHPPPQPSTHPPPQPSTHPPTPSSTHPPPPPSTHPPPPSTHHLPPPSTHPPPHSTHPPSLSTHQPPSLSANKPPPPSSHQIKASSSYHIPPSSGHYPPPLSNHPPKSLASQHPIQPSSHQPLPRASHHPPPTSHPPQLSTHHLLPSSSYHKPSFNHLPPPSTHVPPSTSHHPPPPTKHPLPPPLASHHPKPSSSYHPSPLSNNPLSSSHPPTQSHQTYYPTNDHPPPSSIHPTLSSSRSQLPPSHSHPPSSHHPSFASSSHPASSSSFPSPRHQTSPSPSSHHVPPLSSHIPHSSSCYSQSPSIHPLPSPSYHPPPTSTHQSLHPNYHPPSLQTNLHQSASSNCKFPPTSSYASQARTSHIPPSQASSYKSQQLSKYSSTYPENHSAKSYSSQMHLTPNSSQSSPYPNYDIPTPAHTSQPTSRLSLTQNNTSTTHSYVMSHQNYQDTLPTQSSRSDGSLSTSYCPNNTKQIPTKNLTNTLNIQHSSQNAANSSAYVHSTNSCSPLSSHSRIAYSADTTSTIYHANQSQPSVKCQYSDSNSTELNVKRPPAKEIELNDCAQNGKEPSWANRNAASICQSSDAHLSGENTLDASKSNEGKAGLVEKFPKKLIKKEFDKSTDDSSKTVEAAAAPLTEEEELNLKFDKLLDDLASHKDTVTSKKSCILGRRYNQKVQLQYAVDNNEVIVPETYIEEEESESEREEPIKKFRGKFKSIKDKAVERVILTYASHSDESATEMIPDEDESDFEEELIREIEAKSRKGKLKNKWMKLRESSEESKDRDYRPRVSSSAREKRKGKKDEDFTLSSSYNSSSSHSSSSDDDSNSSDSSQSSSSDFSSSMAKRKNMTRKRCRGRMQSSSNSDEEFIPKRKTRRSKKLLSDDESFSSRSRKMKRKLEKRSLEGKRKLRNRSKEGIIYDEEEEGAKNVSTKKRKKMKEETGDDSDTEENAALQNKNISNRRKGMLKMKIVKNKASISSSESDKDEEKSRKQKLVSDSDEIFTPAKPKNTKLKIVDSESDFDEKSVTIETKNVDLVEEPEYEFTYLSNEQLLESNLSDSVLVKLNKIRLKELCRDDVLEMKNWRELATCEMNKLLAELPETKWRHSWKRPLFGGDDFRRGWQTEVKKFKTEVARIPKRLVITPSSPQSILLGEKTSSGPQKKSKEGMKKGKSKVSPPAKNTRGKSGIVKTSFPIMENDRLKVAARPEISNVMERFFEKVLGGPVSPEPFKKLAAFEPFTPASRTPTGLTPTPSLALSLIASDDSDRDSLASIRTDIPASDSVPVARRRSSIANSLIKKLRKKYKDKTLDAQWLNKTRSVMKPSSKPSLLPTPGLSADNEDSNSPLKYNQLRLSTFFRKDSVNRYPETFDDLKNGINEFTPVLVPSRTRNKSKAILDAATLKAVFGADPLVPSPIKDQLKKSKVDSIKKIKGNNNKRSPIQQDLKPRELKELVLSGHLTGQSQSPVPSSISQSSTPVDFLFNDDDDSEIRSETTLGELAILQGMRKSRKKLRKFRKFRSGFDYIRKKKKTKTEEDLQSSKRKIPVRKRMVWPEENKDIANEIKGWVINKGLGETVLHKAARLQYHDVVMYCLESSDYNVNSKDNAGYTPLHEACNRGHLDIAQALCAHHAHVNASGYGGMRPLHEAIENGHIELARLLLAYGADPSLSTYGGQSCLALATDPQTERFVNEFLADLKGKRVCPWHIFGPSKLFDLHEQGLDIFTNCPGSYAKKKLCPDASSLPVVEKSELKVAIKEEPKDWTEEDEDQHLIQVTFEASDKLLPSIYNVLDREGAYLLLRDLLDYLSMTRRELIIAVGSMETLHLNLADCDKNVKGLSIGYKQYRKKESCKGMVTLVKYSASVKKLLNVEVTEVK